MARILGEVLLILYSTELRKSRVTAYIACQLESASEGLRPSRCAGPRLRFSIVCMLVSYPAVRTEDRRSDMMHPALWLMPALFVGLTVIPCDGAEALPDAAEA